MYTNQLEACMILQIIKRKVLNEQNKNYGYKGQKCNFSQI